MPLCKTRDCFSPDLIEPWKEQLFSVILITQMPKFVGTWKIEPCAMPYGADQLHVYSVEIQTHELESSLFLPHPQEWDKIKNNSPFQGDFMAPVAPCGSTSEMKRWVSSFAWHPTRISQIDIQLQVWKQWHEPQVWRPVFPGPSPSSHCTCSGRTTTSTSALQAPLLAP